MSQNPISIYPSKISFLIKKIAKRATINISYCTGILDEIYRFQISQPFFIVGTGRCGSSLLYRILKTHPDISGFPSEANDLWHPKFESTSNAQLRTHPIESDPMTYTKLSVNCWPHNHSKKIKRTFNGFHLIKGRQKVFFIKSAMISFMIPQIIKIYPEAKFIHIYRSGPSVVESYFKKNYQKYKNYRPKANEYYLTCAQYWNKCILKIEEDVNILSLNAKNAFWELSYESLCDNYDATLKELATFLNVSFDKFTFNKYQIHNCNYKAVNAHQNPNLKELINHEIQTAMKLKGYIS